MATVTRQRVCESIMASGIVETEKEALVLSPVTAKLKHIVRGPGSRVEKNDTILYLDTEMLVQSISCERDQLELKENSYYLKGLTARNSALDFEHKTRVKELKVTALETQLSEENQLLEVGGISKERIRKTKQELLLARKELVLIKKQNIIGAEKLKKEKQAQELEIRIKRRELLTKIQKLKATTVCASSSGVIISISKKEGEIISKDNELVRISNLSSFKITGNISDSQAGKIKSGGRVFAINNGVKLEGVIGNIRPEVNNGQVKFDVFLKNSSHPSLRPNMQLELQLIISEKNNVLSLPDGPFFDGSKQLDVFCVKGTTATKMPIKVGLNNFETIEIMEGLHEGDKVIISDVSKYKHLQKVEIRN